MADATVYGVGASRRVGGELSTGAGFVPYPVKPAALFVSFDLLTAVCFGLAIGGLAANSIALLMVTNGFLVLAYSAYCYKYISLISDIRSGKRGDATGSLSS